MFILILLKLSKLIFPFGKGKHIFLLFDYNIFSDIIHFDKNKDI